MQLRSFLCGGLALALLASFSVTAQTSNGGSKATRSETDSVVITFKVFVTEEGAFKSAEFLSIKPSVRPADQASLTKAASEAMRSWTFTPKGENGKFVAGELIVPFVMDLSGPIPIDGT